MKRIWRNFCALFTKLFSNKQDDNEELRYPISPSEPEVANYPEPGTPVVLNYDEKQFNHEVVKDDKQVFFDVLKELGIDNVQVLDASEFEAMTAKRLEKIREFETNEELDKIAKHIEQRQMDLYPGAAELIREHDVIIPDTRENKNMLIEKTTIHQEPVQEVSKDTNSEPSLLQEETETVQESKPFNVQSEEVLPHITAKPRKRLHWVVTNKDGDHVYSGTNFPEYIKEHGLDIEYKKAYRFSKNKNKKDRLFKGEYKFIVSEQQVTNK